jgi:hypothetical protein
MKARTVLFGLATAILVAGLARGQTALPRQPQSDAATEKPISPQPTREQAESIEVMRRLLKQTIDRRLPGYGGKALLAVDPGGVFLFNIVGLGSATFAPAAKSTFLYSNSYAVPQPNKSGEECAIEGTRLPGYGLVFDVQVPVHFIETRKSETADSKPLSQWDVVQKELHGEEVPAASKAHRPEPETIASDILTSLAENGHHLSASNMLSGERVSVIVTLRQGQRCDLCHALQATLGEGVTWRASGQLFGQMATPDPNNQAEIIGVLTKSWSIAQPKNVTQSAGSAPRGEKEADDQLLLGDLHFKQGRYNEAMAAYQKALDKNPVSTPGGLASGDYSRMEIASKLAQVQHAVGDHKGALDTLAKLQALIQSAEKNAAGPLNSAGKVKGAEGNSEQLPSNLIITVTRENLDAFHAGTIDLERFKKAATVDMQMFLPKANLPKPPPVKASGEPKP